MLKQKKPTIEARYTVPPEGEARTVKIKTLDYKRPKTIQFDRILKASFHEMYLGVIGLDRDHVAYILIPLDYQFKKGKIKE